MSQSERASASSVSETDEADVRMYEVQGDEHVGV